MGLPGRAAKRAAGMTDNTERDPFPDAAALYKLLDLLTLEPDPVIHAFSPMARTPQFVQSLRRSERVIDSGGDMRQKALCTFHIGLFYLHWQENVGAAHYFQRAGRYWQITPLPHLVCLASLAEGCAWHRARDDEAALIRLKQTERQLGRLARTLSAANPTDRVRELHDYAEQLEETLKQALNFLLQPSDRESGAGVDPPTTNMEDD